MTRVIVTSSYRGFVLYATGGDFAAGQRTVQLAASLICIGCFAEGQGHYE